MVRAIERLDCFVFRRTYQKCIVTGLWSRKLATRSRFELVALPVKLLILEFPLV